MKELASLIEKIIQKLRSGYLKDIITETVWIYRYASGYWKWILLYILLGLLVTGTGLGSSLLFKDLIDAVSSKDSRYLATLLGGYILLKLAALALGAFTSRMSTEVSTRASNEIRSDVFRRFLDVDWQALREYHSGDLLSRVNSDVATVAGSVLGWIPSLVIGAVRLVASLAVILYFDPVMAVIALLGAPVTLLGSRIFLPRMKEFGNRSREAQAETTAFCEETLQNLQAIKAFDLKGHHASRLISLQDHFRDVVLDFNRFSIKTHVLMSSVSLVVSLLCMGWGVYRLWNDAISFGTIVLFLQLAGMVSSAFSSLVSLVPSAISATVAANRIMTILDLPMENDAVSPEAQALLDQGADASITIQARDVHFTYEDRTEVFEGLSLQAAPGEIIGIVSPSGGGKTTLIRMLLGLITPAKGQVLFESGGVSAEFTPCLRRLVAYVAQEKFSFSGTIAETLRVSRPSATDQELEEALRTACAWNFVSRLPKGIHTPLGERGAGLSEGQVQRLSIARALLSDAPVLLMDEATSALDFQTERQVLDHILSASHRRTVIVTTHRPAMLMHCTRVYSIRDKQAFQLSPEEIECFVEQAVPKGKRDR